MQPFESPLPILSDLFSDGEVQVYSKADSLPIASQCYQIVSGYVALCEVNGHEHKKLIFVFGKNDIFPHPFQLFDRRPGRTYQYCALGITQVRVIAADAVMEAINSNHELGVAYVRYLGNLLNMAFERIGDLEDLTVKERLKKRLLYFADRFGEPGEDRVLIDVPFTNADIALSIGATRETVNRMLKQLEKEKKLSMRDRKIIIHRKAFLP